MENEDKYILAHTLISKYGRNLEAHYKLKKQFKAKANYVEEANNAILNALSEGKFHAYLRPHKKSDILIKVPQSYWEDGSIKEKIDKIHGYQLINIKISVLFRHLESQLSSLERFLLMPKMGKKSFNWATIPELATTFRYPFINGDEIYYLNMPELGARWLKLNSYFRTNYGKIVSTYFISTEVSEYYKEENFAPVSLPHKNRKTISTEMWLVIIKSIYLGAKTNLKQEALINDLKKYLDDNIIKFDENGKSLETDYHTYLIRKIWTELKIGEDKRSEKAAEENQP